MNPMNSTNHEPRTMNSFKVAILGAGNWGKNHVRVFCELLGEKNIIVCDPDVSRREAMKAAHPGVSLSSEPVLSDVDAVVIATPAVTHFDLAREALLAGRHVLVEKPITLASRNAEELIELAESRDRVLMVNHLLEYHPAIQGLKELVDRGRLGRLLHLSSQRLNLGVIRIEENVLWSLAPHDISIMLYLLGEEPVEVSTHGGIYLQPGIEDVAYLALRFPSGTLGHVHVSWLDPVKNRRLTVVGERAMAVYDDLASNRLVLYHKRAEERGGRYIPQEGESETVLLSEVEPMRVMAEAFLEAVRTGENPLSDGKDGLRVLHVLEAAQESMDSGKAGHSLGGSNGC